jgi:nucleotide-binding universal stress UspA family protein
MPFSFKTILVPVDFSINTEVAVNKALEVADKEGATIHLMHVLSDRVSRLSLQNNKKLSEPIAKTAEPTIDQMIKEWKDTIQQTNPHITVCCWMLHHSSIQQSIAKKAEKLKVDLVVIGKKSTHTWFPFLNTVISNDLARTTGCAVLTVKPGSLHNKIKTLVVPVTEDIPRHKMEAIAALCKINRLKVHLVSFMTGENVPVQFSSSALLKLYQWLKDTLHCQVEYTVLHNDNKARAVLLYAEKVNADMLLVNPVSETRIGWMNRHISDVLSPDSKVQVLTVHQTN